MHKAVYYLILSVGVLTRRQPLLQGEEIGRAAVQTEAVEAVVRVSVAPEIPGLLLQGQDLQVSQIVFQVVAGFLGDV